MKQYFNREFLLSNKQLIIKATVILCLIAAAFIVFVLGNTENTAETEDLIQNDTLLSSETIQETEEQITILVDVGGAVKKPHVVELEENSRVADAIDAAGGLKDNADTAGINQATFLADGEKVYIPTKGESISGVEAAVQAQAGSGGNAVTGGSKVNLNTATSEELQTLNGVGPATAEKILEYRTASGSFKSIEELKNVNGIGDKTFEKLKEQITV